MVGRWSLCLLQDRNLESVTWIHQQVMVTGSRPKSIQDNRAGQVFCPSRPNWTTFWWKVGDLGLFWDHTPTDIKQSIPLKQHPHLEPSGAIQATPARPQMCCSWVPLPAHPEKKLGDTNWTSAFLGATKKTFLPCSSALQLKTSVVDAGFSCIYNVPSVSGCIHCGALLTCPCILGIASMNHWAAHFSSSSLTKPTTATSWCCKSNKRPFLPLYKLQKVLKVFY